MKKDDLRLLVSTEDRVFAENIKSALEEFGIYTISVSDNPASSFMTTYFGINPMETIDIKIINSDYQRAIEILNNSPFKEIIIKS